MEKGGGVGSWATPILPRVPNWLDPALSPVEEIPSCDIWCYHTKLVHPFQSNSLDMFEELVNISSQCGGHHLLGHAGWLKVLQL